MKAFGKFGVVMALLLLAGACATDAIPEDTAAPTTAVATTSETTTVTSEATTTGTEAETTTTTAGGEVDLGSFCQTAIETDITVAQGPEVDFETATEEEIQQAMTSFGEQIQPLLDELEANIPEEISEEVGTVLEGIRTGLESAEDPMGDPAYQEAVATVDQFIVDNCDVSEVAVTGVDYAFEGVPATLEPGVTAFRFTNEGQEVHEMVLLRINDDVEASIEDLLELPEEEAQQMVEDVAFTFAPPGGEATTFADLGPGRYGVICFIPVGTTSFEDLPEDQAAAEAPPHFTQGMVAVFQIES